MKIIFLESSARDVEWMRRYYKSVFPEGAKNARRHYLSAIKAISANPTVGHPSERVATARELHIHRTPFTFIYRINGEYVEILRVLDGRSGE